MQSIKLRILSYVVIAYMLIAFAWWSVLLFTKNKDAYLAKRELHELALTAAERTGNEQAITISQEKLADLQQKYERQQWMIAGEAIFVVISLVISIFLINRSYNRQIDAATQRRNFLLSITHELKSPIAAIRLVLDTFRKRDLPKPMQEKLTINALKETTRLQNLVNDLLLAAKVENAYEPHANRIDLSEIGEELVSRLKERHPSVEIHYDSDPDLPVIIGDHLGLTAVMSNLLENAVKYSSGEANVELTINKNGTRVFFEVADEGIGIEESDRKRIFQQFYRVGSEDTRKTKGTGLGLYIVDQIVKAHQGHVEVLDNEPKGTRFKVTLPIEPERLVNQTIAKKN